MKEQAIDSALILRKSFEHGEALSEIEISELLKESKLVEKLTRDYEDLFVYQKYHLLNNCHILKKSLILYLII